MKTTELSTWTKKELEDALHIIFQGLISGAFGKLSGEGNTSDEINSEISALTIELGKRK